MDYLSSFHNRATKVMATMLGALVGFAGIEHGILEVMQGNVTPDGFMVDAIGPGQKLWPYASEPTLTLIPNMLISGILSILIGGAIIVWSIRYLDSKHGSLILLALSLACFLVGGGFAPIVLTVLAVLMAAHIHKPLRFWRAVLPDGLCKFLSVLWPWAFVLGVTAFLVAVEIAIFGYPFLWFFDALTTSAIQLNLAYAMLTLTLLSVMIAFAYDIRQRKG